MKKAMTLLILINLLSFPSVVFSKEFSLFIKPCKSCEWLSYHVPFRLKEQCEIARQGNIYQRHDKVFRDIIISENLES